MAKAYVSKWKWFGHAGHFICGTHCRFHPPTQVGKYLISTVGEDWPYSGGVDKPTLSTRTLNGCLKTYAAKGMILTPPLEIGSDTWK